MANGDQTIGQVEALSAAVEALRKAQEDLAKSARKTNGVLSQQAELASQMSGAVDSSGLDRLERSLGGAEEAMRRASGAADDAQDRLAGLEGQVNSLTSAEERNAAAKKSFVAAVGRAGAALKLLGGFIGSAVSGMFSLGKAIFMLPFRLLSGLVEFAADGGGGLELLEAYERVRKTFGDLASGPARDLITSFQGIRSETGSLAGSGISLARVFGVGPGGLAAAMDFVREQAEGLGAQFQLLRGEFIESAAELIVFQKGMGLSAEQFKAFSTLAIGSGSDLTDTLGEVANLSIQLGDRFNLSSKQIAQGMATLANEFVAFGHLTQQELAATTVYAMELGVEIEALTKVAEKFSTFESAAESASKLNQALGLQLDTMALLTAESPADQLKQIQDAFFATGRSVTDLNRAERELLATQLGLSGADLAAALSPENAGKSLEEIQAAAAGAADAPLTAEESMMRLADSIERVFESGNGMRSFFDAFSQGFEQGLRWFGPTRELFLNIRQSLRVTRQEGREFARMFVANFPGVTEVVEGLRDAFDPTKFRKFLTAVSGVFREFFTTMDPDNPSSSVGSFLEKIQGAFGETFGGDVGGGILQKLKDGFSKIGQFLFNAFLGVLPYIASGLTYLLDQLASILRSDGQSEIGEAFGEVMESLGEVFVASWERLSPVLMESLQQLMESLGPALRAGLDALYENVIKPYGLWVVGAMLLLFAPQLAAGVLLQVVGAAISAVVTVVGGALGGIASLLGLGGGGMLDGIKESLKKIGEIIDEIGKINVSNIGKAIVSMVKMAAFFTVGLGAFVAGVGIVYAIAKAFGLFNDPAKLSLMLQVTAIAVLGSIGLILAGNALAGASVGIGTAIAGMAAGALLMTVALPLFILGLVGAMAAWDAAGLTASAVLATMAALGTAILATAGIVAGAAAFGALLLTPGANLLFTAAFTAGVSALALALATTATVLAPKIKDVIEAMSGVDPERGEAALEIFSSTLQAMQPITDIALAAMAIKDADPASISSMIDNIKDSMLSLLSGISETIVSIVSTLSSVGLSEEQMRTAQAVGSILGAFAQLLGTLPEPLDLTNRQIRQLRRSGVRGEELTELISGSGAISNMTALIEGIAGQVPALGRAIATIGELNITEEGIRRIEAVSDLMGSVTSFYGDLKDVTTEQVQSTIDVFASIIEAYNDFYDAIDDLDSAVDVNAAIQRFGNSLGIRNQTVSVNNEPINVTVNLNVTMDADQIATVLTADSRGVRRLVTAANVAPS